MSDFEHDRGTGECTCGWVRATMQQFNVLPTREQDVEELQRWRHGDEDLLRSSAHGWASGFAMALERALAREGEALHALDQQRVLFAKYNAERQSSKSVDLGTIDIGDRLSLKPTDPFDFVRHLPTRDYYVLLHVASHHARATLGTPITQRSNDIWHVAMTIARVRPGLRSDDELRLEIRDGGYIPSPPASMGEWQLGLDRLLNIFRELDKQHVQSPAVTWVEDKAGSDEPDLVRALQVLRRNIHGTEYILSRIAEEDGLPRDCGAGYSYSGADELQLMAYDYGRSVTISGYKKSAAWYKRTLSIEDFRRLVHTLTIPVSIGQVWRRSSDGCVATIEGCRGSGIQLTVRDDGRGITSHDENFRKHWTLAEPVKALDGDDKDSAGDKTIEDTDTGLDAALRVLRRNIRGAEFVLSQQQCFAGVHCSGATEINAVVANELSGMVEIVGTKEGEELYRSCISQNQFDTLIATLTRPVAVGQVWRMFDDDRECVARVYRLHQKEGRVSLQVLAGDKLTVGSATSASYETFHHYWAFDAKRTEALSK